MKKRILALLLVLSLMAGCMPVMAAAGTVRHSENGFLQDFAPLNPSGLHVVEDVSSFLAIGTDPNASYILMKDIDLGEWTSSFSFGGILLGNGHTIKYRSAGKLNRTGDYAVGLFTQLDGAYIENLRIEAVIDDGYEGVSDKPVRIGALAAQAGDGAYLLNCTADVQITVSTVQWLNSERSAFEAVAPADTAALGTGEAQTAVGGLIGYIAPETDAMLQSCRTTGAITGADCTGGLVGQCMGSISLLGCENRAAVTGVICVGGLIGSGSGACSIAQSANRGKIRALRAYAGGLAGSVTCMANDSFTDCANIGDVICGAADGQGDFAGGLAGMADCAVLRCVNKASVIGAAPQNFVGSGSNVWEETCYAFDPEKDNAAIRESILQELNMEMVWTQETDVDIPYPRMLCGEQVNQYRVAYVEAVQEAVDMYPQLLNRYVMLLNPAGILGENYRDGWNNELNSAWSATLSLSKVLDFDLSAFDDLAKYDTLICDLMLSEYFYKASQARAKSSAYDLFMEGCAENASAGSNLILAGTAALRTELTYQYMSMCKNYSSGNSYLLSHEGLAQRFIAQGDRAKNAAGSLMEINSSYSDVTGMASIILNYFSVYQNMHTETELLNAAYDVYNSSFTHLDTLLSRISLEASMGDHSYPEPFDAKSNLSLLSAAIDDFRRSAVANKKHPQLSEIGSALGDHFTALLGGAGSWAEWMYLDKLSMAVGAQWLSELGLYKGAITIGRGINTYIGNDDYAYNGNLLNCAGYLADMTEPIVQEAYLAFQDTPNYETALYFHDAIVFYLSLQILSMDYAQKMISGKFYNNYKEHASMEDMLSYRSELIALLTAFDFTGR